MKKKLIQRGLLGFPLAPESFNREHVLVSVWCSRANELVAENHFAVLCDDELVAVDFRRHDIVLGAVLQLCR